ncbi:MAG: 3-deoxy-7-phosphoheptulonate synthase [Chlamydiota bacterium]
MHQTPLPSPEEIRNLYPLSYEAQRFIRDAQSQAKQILLGMDPRRVMIVGPCSIHDKASAVEYAKRFKELAERVKQTCFLIMRVYVEKPRTTFGWKGMLYDPHLDGTDDIKTGLMWTRQLLHTLTEMHVPCATEFVDPLAALYFEDLITWGFIGARTCASQPHRQFASQLKIPVGFKNSTDGNLLNAVQGVLSAGASHTSLHINMHGKVCAARSSGNPFAHIVLRGACDFTNYDANSVDDALEKLKRAHLPQRMLIDCSHGNSQKQFEQQPAVFMSILEQMERGNQHIFGMMLESHLESGSQPISDDLQYAVSITDPCIDWKTTEDLIYSANSTFSTVSVGVS